MKQPRSRFWTATVALALVALLEGCGRSGPVTGTVEGQITHDQRPVTQGNVVFENAEEGLAYVAPLDAEGRYRLAGVKLADYLVCIKPIEPKLPDETSGNPGPIGTPAGAMPDPANIPREFRSSQSTPLKATVVEGTISCNYDLARPR